MFFNYIDSFRRNVNMFVCAGEAAGDGEGGGAEGVVID